MDKLELVTEVADRLSKAYTDPKAWDRFAQPLLDRVKEHDFEDVGIHAILEDLDRGRGWLEIEIVRGDTMRRVLVSRWRTVEVDSPWENLYD